MKEYDRRRRRSRSRSRGISVTSKESCREGKYRKSICSSVFTEKSCNTEIFSVGSFCSSELTPGSKKPAIIKSMVLKNEAKKGFCLLKSNKENERATINYQKKLKNSVLGYFQ